MDLCQRTYTFPLLKEETSYGDMTDIQTDVYESFLSADSRISVYIGNEDTPEEFEKAALNVVLEVLDHQVSVENGLEIIQDIWDRLSQETAS